MQTTPAPAVTAAWRNKIVATVFLLLIFAPILDSLLHVDPTPFAKENRTLSVAPRWTSASGLKQFCKEVEAYANDHFGFRNYLVHLHNKARYSLFADQTSGSVIIGKNDWLFFAGEEMVEHYRGTKRFTGKQLESWQQLLERRRDWLAQRGIKYVFVVAPDKQSIYPDLLPDWITKVRPETMLDEFLAHMRTHSTVEVIDLRPVLSEARKIAPTYFNTDTHWNQFGGFVATREIVRKLSLSDPLELEWFDRQHKRMPGGDLVTLLGLDANELSEENFVTFAAKTNVPRLSEMMNPAGNTNQNRRAVVFHDSFATNLKPFLSYYFADISYRPKYELDADFIKKEHPTLVMTEMLERYLVTQDVEKLQETERRTLGEERAGGQ